MQRKQANVCEGGLPGSECQRSKVRKTKMVCKENNKSAVPTWASVSAAAKVDRLRERVLASWSSMS